MPYKPIQDPDAAGAMEREAPLHAKYKEVKPDLPLHPGKSMRAAMLPGKAGIPPEGPCRGDAAGKGAVSSVSATAHGRGRW